MERYRQWVLHRRYQRWARPHTYTEAPRGADETSVRPSKAWTDGWWNLNG